MDILFVGKRKEQETVGVTQKLECQISAFEKLGHTVWATDMGKSGCWLSNGGESRLLRGYKSYAPAGLSPALNHAKMLLQAVKFGGADFGLCYIRKPVCGPLFLRALKKLKKRGVPAIVEIPTWPYDEEIKAQKSLASRAFLLMDRHYRKRMYKYVAAIANYNRLDKLLLAPGLILDNGVDVENIPLHTPPESENPIGLMAVSSMAFWHGYDRAIAGLAQYYKKEENRKRPVVLHLVGEGPEKGEWQQLAIRLGVQESVIFHGRKTGDALAEVFNMCHIGLSCMGWYRKNVDTSSDLKTREYIARGIPFVYSCKDNAAEAVAPFGLMMPNNETPIDIERVLTFYDDVKYKPAVQTLRKYAEENLTWQKQMQKVIDYIS